MEDPEDLPYVEKKIRDGLTFQKNVVHVGFNIPAYLGLEHLLN